MSVELIVILGLYIIFWQGYQLRRRLSGLGHATLLITLAGILAVPVFNYARNDGLIPIAPEATDIVIRIIVLTPCLSLFVFRLAAAGHRVTSRAVLAALASGAVMIGAIVVTGQAVLRNGGSLRYTTASFSNPLSAGYHTGSGLYYGILLLAVAVWMVRYTRTTGRHVRIGVRIASVGIFAMSALCIGRAIPPGVALFGGPLFVAPPALLGGVSATTAPIIFIGLSYPLLVNRGAALRAWMRQRHAYRRIEPLWTASRDAFPEAILPEQGRPSLAFRLRRRRAECYDGLHYVRRNPDNSSGAPGQRAAVERLRAAVERYEQDHLDGESIWATVDRQRSEHPPQAGHRDHQLLESLADTVENTPLELAQRA